jgi:anion-transporting  ArsA/GET3 family ATPase
VIQDCDCRFCREKKASQTAYIQELKESYIEKEIIILPDYGGEVLGEALMKMAEDIYTNGTAATG